MGPDAAPVASAVLEATHDPNLFVRWAAARTIGKLGPVEVKRGVSELARLISDEDLDVRAIAAHGLERYGPAARAAVPALTRTVNVGDSEIRVGVMRALDGIGPDAKSAIPAISRALSHSDYRVPPYRGRGSRSLRTACQKRRARPATRPIGQRAGRAPSSQRCLTQHRAEPAIFGQIMNRDRTATDGCAPPA